MPHDMIRILIIFLALIAHVRADDSFGKANADYRAGRFGEAAERYEALLERDGPRVSVLQNLGSAYHRLGEDGRAIVAFERALLLKPNDADLKANLKLVRDRAAVFSATEPSGWTDPAGWMSRRSWSWLVFAGVAAWPVAAVWWVGFRGRSRRWLALPAAVVGTALAAGSWWAVEKNAGIESRAVIVADPAKVRLSPFESADEKGTLAEGREVVVGEARDGYVWVNEAEASTEGWVLESEVEPVIPRR